MVRARSLALALASLGACRTPPDATPPPDPSLSASVAPTASADPTATVASTSAAATPPPTPAKTLADLQGLASREPPWPSGPGVACGEVRCGVGELCCQGAEPRCLPLARENECLDARGTALRCDESSDCGAGKICCFGVIYHRQAHRVSCETPSVCAVPLSRPGSFPIPGAELCARGGSCRSAKLVCVADDDMPSGGRCISNVGTVACNGGKPCPADRPFCLWSAATRTGECIPRGPWDHEEGVYACDGPENCVGTPCCTAGQRSLCSMDCEESFRFAEYVCHRDADCPRPTRNATQRIVWRCVGVGGDAPPALRECSQRVIELP